MGKLIYRLETLINEAPLTFYEREECRASLHGLQSKLKESNEKVSELRNELESVKQTVEQIKKDYGKEKGTK